MVRDECCTQRDEAVQLVRDAVLAGVLGDLGSGSNVDMCVITEHDSQLVRSYDSHVVNQATAVHTRLA